MSSFSSPFATTGQYVFGNEFREDWTPGEATLVITSSTPTSFVSVDLINNDIGDNSSVDFGQMIVMFKAGNPVVLHTGPIPIGQFTTLLYESVTDDIVSVEITGDFDPEDPKSKGEDVLIDNLKYESEIPVPEPSSASYVVVGLGALLLFARGTGFTRTFHAAS